MTILCHKRVWWFRLICSCTSLHNRSSASTNSWGTCFDKSVVNPTLSPCISLEINLIAVLKLLIFFPGCFHEMLRLHVYRGVSIRLGHCVCPLCLPLVLVRPFFSQTSFYASPHLHEFIKHSRLLGGQEGGEPSGNRTKTNPATPTAFGRRRTHQDTIR